MSSDADLVRLINGYQASQAIHVAARLGLADLLGSGAQSPAELAAATQTHPDALHRLLRALASIGVLEDREGGRFALAALGHPLHGRAASTCAALALLVGQSGYWQAWAGLLDAVRSGGADLQMRSPEEAQAFDRALAGDAEQRAQALLAGFDLSRCRHVVDVGCGDGLVLARILAARPSLRGTMLDRPQIAVRVAEMLAAAGLSDRCRALGGNFFVDVPAAADAYLLNAVLHEWSDGAAIDILRVCRKAMAPSGRIAIIEHVIGSSNSGSVGAFMDLTMLVANGGRERTREEFATIIAAAGLRLLSITPTTAPVSIIEAALGTS
jgi:SAM-dependent methyltransferase